MLNKPIFYHATVRKLVATFGGIFNDIHLQRKDNLGSVQQTLKVPLTFAPKEKWFVRDAQDPDAGSDDQASVGLVLPRMSFDLTGISYDAGRKLSSSVRNVAVQPDPADNTKFNFQYREVPYNFNLSLYVFVDHIEDGLAIVEQILPFFNPDHNVSIVDIPTMDVKKDWPVSLQSVSPEYQYEGSFDGDTRKIIWTLDFLAKGYIYPPVEDDKVVLQSDIQQFDETAVPGLQTYSVSIEPSDAKADEAFTFDETKTIVI